MSVPHNNPPQAAVKRRHPGRSKKKINPRSKGRQVGALLDKYADEGVENIEDMKTLQVNPLNQFGTPHEIVNMFGGKRQYLKALTELECEIYRQVA